MHADIGERERTREKEEARGGMEEKKSGYKAERGGGDEEKRQNLKFIFQLENYGCSEESGEKLNLSCSFLKRVRMTETALQIQLV